VALDQIFERFYRGNSARNRNGHSGLGLAIARSILSNLGGEISAVNRTGRRGAVFTVTLPAHS
jgi:signal transduction histidine kinase